MDYRLLGSLEVLRAGQPVKLPNGKPRMLLAALLLHANQVVSTTRLIDWLWESEVPATARSTVQYFVHKLRAALDPDQTGSPLRTEAGGYLLEVGPDSHDIARLEALVRSGQAERARGDLVAAAARFEQARALWRGPALADFADVAFAQPEIARLEELGVAATEEAIDIGLALGRHAELVGELEGLVRAHPLRERLLGSWILALYRSGRQAEALAAYRATRREFVRELGIEPGPDLRRLEQSILAQDPALDPPSPPSATPPLVRMRAPAVPADVPATATPPAMAPRQAASGTPATAPGAVRRLVSVLVAGMVVVDADPELLWARQERLAAQMADRVARFGGRLYPSPVTTPLGSRVLAVLGAQHVREDDPERAVRAALELCALSAGDQPVRVGVDTGTALLIPAPNGVEGLSGSLVDTAARLQATAPAGGVLVGAATYRATRRTITYARRPASGGWLPLGPRSHIGIRIAEADGDRPSALMERDRELGLLRQMLDRVRRGGEPQLVTVVGTPGIGKSRLVGEFGRVVEADPELIVWRQGRCPADPNGDRATYGALGQILAAHAGILDSDDAATAAGKLGQAVTGVIADPAQAAATTDALRVLVQAAAAPRPLAADRTATGPQPALVTSWIRLVEAIAAERPTVLVLEDLHEASAELLEAVDSLADRVGPVPLLVVTTTRPELLSARPGWGGGKPNAVTFSLAPLTEGGSGLLLDRLLTRADRSLPPAIREQVLAKAAGNPLYLEEYVRLLTDQPDPAAEPAPIPEQVEQLITARLDSLPGGDSALLGVLAVLGDPGSAHTILAIGTVQCDQLRDQTVAEVEAGLMRLVGRDLLRRTRPLAASGGLAYVFRHPLIREVAYRQLLRADRAAMHQRAAAWLQSLPGDRAERIEQVADHYQQAVNLTYPDGPLPSELNSELAGEARGALRAAGLHAMGLGTLGAAARRLGQALTLWPASDPDRAGVLLELGRALAYSSHTGHDVLVQVRDAAVEAGRHDQAAAAEALLGHLARIRARPDRATEHVRSALARPVGATPAEVDALAAQAIDLLIADRHQDATKVATRAVELATELGLPAQAANGRSIRSHARLLAGDHDALPEAEQALADLDAHRHPVAVFAHFGFAHALYWHGDLTRCAAAVASGRKVADAAGAAIRTWFDVLEAGLAYQAAQWDQAEALAGALLAESPSGHAAYLLPWCLVLRGRIRLARGELDHALTDAQAALSQAEAAGDVRYRHVALALVGRALSTAGQDDKAGAVVAQLLSDLAAQPARGCATADLGLLLCDLADAPRILLDRLPPTPWHTAIRALASNDLAGAIDRLAALGAHLDEAAARLRLAQRLAGSDQPAEAAHQADQAATTFQKAGATADLHRAEALMAALPHPAAGRKRPLPAGHRAQRCANSEQGATGDPQTNR